MARYRSIKVAMLGIRKDDPDRSINESMLRKLIVEGYIPTIRLG